MAGEIFKGELEHTLGTDAHLILGVGLQEALHTAAGELQRKNVSSDVAGGRVLGRSRTARSNPSAPIGEGLKKTQRLKAGKPYTNLQAGLRAVRLLSLASALLRASLSTD
jgi:hypothetical protein